MNDIEKLLDLDVSGVNEPKEATVEIKLSKLGGESFTFPIVELDNATRAKIMEDAISVVSDTDGGQKIKTDIYGVAKTAILAGCPVFADKRFRDKFSARSGGALIDKMLTVSEAVELSEAIQKLGDGEAGLLGDLGTLKDTIKN